MLEAKAKLATQAIANLMILSQKRKEAPSLLPTITLSPVEEDYFGIKRKKKKGKMKK
jgi:hypothetical protein